jgi:hypothetical protein
MKTISIITTVLMFGFFLASCSKEEAKLPPPYTGIMTEEMKIDRGKYIVGTAACDDCHTPKVMTPEGPKFDMSRRLSGHKSDLKMAPIADKSILKDYALTNSELTGWVGPWGTSFAANLTPAESGIANWEFDNFKRAIREGKFKGQENGRKLLPPMPWEVYRNLTDQDLECVFAFLKSLPPIENVVPAPIPPDAAPTSDLGVVE